MMSEHVSKIQNSTMDQGGIDFDFIASTLKEAPEDLRRFCEALEDMLEDHTGKRQSFKHGFMLSDRLNEIKIKELEAVNKDLIEKNVSILVMDYISQGLDLHYGSKMKELEAKLADISERAFNSEHEYKAKLAEAQAVYNSLIDCAARDTLKINELKAKIALLESDNNFSLGKRVVELVHEKFELEAKLDSYIKMRDELIEMNKIKEEKLAEALNGTVLKRYNEAAIVQFGGFGYLNEIK